jgi:hypothetical protein
VVDLDSSEDLFLLISFIVEINLLLGSDLGTIDCGVRCYYLSWDNNYGYMHGVGRLNRVLLCFCDKWVGQPIT